MNVTLIQSDLVWEEKKLNLQAFEKQILDITTASDLIILPEMFTTGFSMYPEKFAEEPNGLTLRKMQEWAKQKNSAITGSFIIKENNKYFNRAYFVFPDGSYRYYDKRHLFRMANEDKHYSSGQSRTIVEYKGWRILLQICYDLRFPVWSRNNLNYDLAIYVANWPEVRSTPWKMLLKARAIENLSYVAGVNRIGYDGNNMAHSGDSALIDFKGEAICSIKAHSQESKTILLDKQKLVQFRQKFPADMDADNFIIN